MADRDDERVWDLMEEIGICMMSTWDGQGLHARPMGAYVRRDDNLVYFLTDVRQQKDDEIARYPQIVLAFADTGDQKYVSVSGTAAVTDDRALIRELWGIPAKAWWDSPDDPNIRVLTFTPHEAEYWDGPSPTVARIKMAIAAATGGRPDLGKAQKVTM